MSPLGAIRPDDWGLPLFLHVLGALVLIGALVLTAAFLLSAWRRRSGESLGQALRTLVLGVLPAWIVLRVSAEWIADKERLNDLDETPAWVDIGYMTSDLGFLLIVAASLLGWLAHRRVRAGGEPGATVRAAAVVIALLLALNLVALYAMTTKPV